MHAHFDRRDRSRGSNEVRAIQFLVMAPVSRRMAPEQLAFLALALILAVLLIYFALTSIPAAVRPTLQPSLQPSSSSSATQSP
jgi:hypothetical protein